MPGAWKNITASNSAACTAFVAIMQRMDHRYSGLNAIQFASWLAPGQYHNAFGWVPTSSQPAELMQVALLCRSRGANRAPEVAMLGWNAADPTLLDSVADTIIEKCIAWLSSEGGDTVRCIVPKSMDFPWIMQLHQKLYELITTPTGQATLTRRVDLRESWLWYVKT